MDYRRTQSGKSSVRAQFRPTDWIRSTTKNRLYLERCLRDVNVFSISVNAFITFHAVVVFRIITVSPTRSKRCQTRLYLRAFCRLFCQIWQSFELLSTKTRESWSDNEYFRWKAFSQVRTTQHWDYADHLSREMWHKAGSLTIRIPQYNTKFSSWFNLSTRITSSQSPSSLSLFITPCTLYSRLKTHLFHNASFSGSFGLPSRTLYSRTSNGLSEHCRLSVLVSSF